MHLCVVSPFPPELTGVGQYGWNVVAGLARSGALKAITVLAQQARGTAADTAAPGVVRVQRAWARDDLTAGMRLAQRLAALRPDVVWFNLGYTVFGETRPANFLGLLAPFVTRRLGLPLVVTLHQVFEVTPPNSIGAKNGRLTTLGARAVTHLLLRSGMVCVTLARYQEKLQALYGAGRIHHIPHGAYGVPEALPHPAAPPEEVLFFGSMAPFKGVPVLLEAFEQLRRRRPQASLTIAGSDHPRFPGYREALRQAVQVTNGQGGVQWLGPQPENELRGLFARARVVALPYLATTGASSVLYRAAAFGRPVVASDLADLRAASDDEQLRIDYVSPENPEALASALEAQLADPARQAVDAAHNLSAMRRMTIEHTCARYLDLFQQARAA